MSEHIPDPNSREPLAVPATWTALATLALATIVGFGLPIPDAAAVGLIGLVGTAGPIVVWYWGRRRAWSGRSVVDIATRPGEPR